MNSIKVAPASESLVSLFEAESVSVTDPLKKYTDNPDAFGDTYLGMVLSVSEKWDCEALSLRETFKPIPASRNWLEDGDLAPDFGF
ncbi:hypothetical protein ACFL6U_20105 [Planctomycetota bacterium]